MRVFVVGARIVWLVGCSDPVSLLIGYYDDWSYYVWY